MVAARTNQEKKRTRGPSGLQQKVIYRCGDLQTRNAVALRMRSSPSRNRLLRATNTVATRFATEPLPAG